MRCVIVTRLCRYPASVQAFLHGADNCRSLHASRRSTTCLRAWETMPGTDTSCDTVGDSDYADECAPGPDGEDEVCGKVENFGSLLPPAYRLPEEVRRFVGAIILGWGAHRNPPLELWPYPFDWHRANRTWHAQVSFSLHNCASSFCPALTQHTTRAAVQAMHAPGRFAPSRRVRGALHGPGRGSGRA
eukprot:3778260-Rhodomonas_salina.1